jgi:hypothetical protein
MQMQSIAIVLLMLTGIYFRHRRSVHIKLMSASMLWDVFLILQIELSRSAIMKASNAGTNPTALNIHVSIAITTVILYGFMIQSGRKYLKLGLPEIRKRHRFLGWTTLIMRLLTLATSFMAVAPKA